MPHAFLFTNGGAFAEALDAAKGLPPQYNAHVYEFRADRRNRSEAWRDARVIDGLTRRHNEEQAQSGKGLEAIAADARARLAQYRRKA